MVWAPSAPGTPDRAVERHGHTHLPDGEDPLPSLLDIIYPVGHLYLSVVATNPATLLNFPGSTWEQVAEGRFLIGVDTGTAAYDTPEETGGNNAFTHSSGGAHQHDTVSSQALTHNNNHDTAGGHTHDEHPIELIAASGAAENTWGSASFTHASGGSHTHAAHADHSVSGHTHESQGSHTHDQHPLPAFFAVYMWKRTA